MCTTDMLGTADWGALDNPELMAPEPPTPEDWTPCFLCDLRECECWKEEC